MANMVFCHCARCFLSLPVEVPEVGNKCPDLQYLVSDSWRQRMWEHVMVNRYAIAVGGAASIQQYVNLLPAMRMNGLRFFTVLCNIDAQR
ncbi:unnamed protein product [Nippostrongylus brasiliensis]|uniref:Secreted protein n=1 Tax=Nippostrongylus brasiliensis TaxID=27835 RepID=A0A0N4XY90_NIPBR|nr:unnamed protein product [Nippostrongylus brasiliensis]